MTLEEVNLIHDELVEQIWDCRYEKDKIHIYTDRALKKVYFGMKEGA